MRVVGLDIGGANLKAADASGESRTRAFPVWRNPGGLPAAIGALLEPFTPIGLLAVTMTAELADCFQTKREGVYCILNAVENCAGAAMVQVWQTGAEFVTSQIAREIPLKVAAANWHALATWAGRLAPEGGAILMDVGTTTCDIIPLSQGVPVSKGFTDRERLISGELVYSGVKRTPLCAIVPSILFRGQMCPVAAELFATTLDVYLTLGDIPDDAADIDTANGRPATRKEALHRLARAICADATEFHSTDARTAAEYVAGHQYAQLSAAVSRVIDRQAGPCLQTLISGSGAFLAERVVRSQPRLERARVTLLTSEFGASVSEAACAFAVAVLATERLAK